MPGPVFSNELRCRNYRFSQFFAQIPCVFFVKLRFIYDAILETFALRKIRKSCDLLARRQEVSQVSFAAAVFFSYGSNFVK